MAIDGIYVKLARTTGPVGLLMDALVRPGWLESVGRCISVDEFPQQLDDLVSAIFDARLKTKGNLIPECLCGVSILGQN